MNYKSRIKKISDAMQIKKNEEENSPILTLEQWERRYNGEDIRSEIPAHRLAEYDEFERIGNERLRQVEEMYYRHNPELLATNYEN